MMKWGSMAVAVMLAAPIAMSPSLAVGQATSAQAGAGQAEVTKYDNEIQQDAQKELKNSKYNGVQAAVENGVIHLTGQVKLYADKLDAEKRVSKIKHANSVVNDIQVAAGETNDQQIADKIGRQLAYDRVGYGNVFNAISVSVNNGVVTLGGHALGPNARNSAVNLAKRTPGVQDVVDKIQVDPPSPLDDQLRERVARAVYGYPSLNKYAINPANPIRITVVNGHVILSGVVDNKSDKDVAGIQANTVPGVFSVTNNIEVAGSEERR